MNISNWLSANIFLPLIPLLLAALLGACAPPAAPGTPLTVFAASSLTDAVTEMAAAFEAAHPGAAVRANLAGSTTLATQLLEGAPADVFLSANEAQMALIVDAGLAAAQPLIFASNRLTIIVPADNPAGLSAAQHLALPDVGLILAAPGVPVREYSDQAIARLGDGAFQSAVYANLLSEEENVRIVAAKVALGEADAGIVYTSDVTPELGDAVLQIAIPEEANLIAVYPIVRLADAPAPALADAFVDFVLSVQGQAILARWGFGPRP
jgi:molybdate transport system substrate-binding protein